MRLAFVFLCMLTAMSCQAASAQVSDVPTDHWAYDAVNDLANKGYVLGYPDGSFLGDRTITRYEFATIIKRILDSLDARATAAGNRATSEVTAPATTMQPAEVSAEDLESIRKLRDEFKVELTVIGARLDKAEANIADLQSKVEKISEILTDEKGPLASVRNDLNKLKRITWSGYLQSRYELYQDGLDEDGRAAEDSLLVRRARLKLTARAGAKATAVVSFDAGQNKVSAKDAYIEYAFRGDPSLGLTLDLGQQNWPFGYEVPHSSSRRETPERALFARRFFPGEKDRGVKLVSPFAKHWLWQIGVFDGTGVETVNTVTTVVTDSMTTPPMTTKLKSGSTVSRDYNNHKDIVANIQYRGENTEFGLSGYWGKGIWDSDRAALIEVDKIRYGTDFRYFRDSMTLKAEYIRAKGVDESAGSFDLGDWVDGYYAQLNYSLNARNVLVARYETLSQDPRRPAFGRRSAWSLGAIHQLDGSSKLKLFCQDNKEETDPIDNNVWRMEWLLAF